MGKARTDCSKVSLIEIPAGVCLGMVAAALEVYPAECMGGLCTHERPADLLTVDSAFPYQKARRSGSQVSSQSSHKFVSFMGGVFPWFKFGDFHSHPYTNYRNCAPLGPSEQDLSEMRVGDVEIIIRVLTARRSKNSWKNTKTGIAISWRRYRFLIKSFVRLRGFRKTAFGRRVPLFREIKTELKGKVGDLRRLRGGVSSIP